MLGSDFNLIPPLLDACVSFPFYACIGVLLRNALCLVCYKILYFTSPAVLELFNPILKLREVSGVHFLIV